MADSVADVRRVVVLLRSWGFRVTEVPGWENRGSGDLTTLGRLEHHTAGSRSGEAPSLRVVTFGRPGLRNSLARWLPNRSGTEIFLIARRASWHPGKGDKGTSRTLSGTEAEHSGSVSEPWTAGSLAAQAAISAAECIVFGVSPQRIWDHKEHATPRGRKIDRISIDPHRWRERVAALVRSGGGSAPPPEPEQEDDETMKYDEKSDRVKELQHAVNLCLDLTGGPPPNGMLKVDGHLGPKTADAVWHCVKRLTIRLDRRSFYVDTKNPSPVLVGYLTAENVRMLAARKSTAA